MSRIVYCKLFSPYSIYPTNFNSIICYRIYWMHQLVIWSKIFSILKDYYWNFVTSSNQIWFVLLLFLISLSIHIQTYIIFRSYIEYCHRLIKVIFERPLVYSRVYSVDTNACVQSPRWFGDNNNYKKIQLSLVSTILAVVVVNDNMLNSIKLELELSNLKHLRYFIF